MTAVTVILSISFWWKRETKPQALLSSQLCRELLYPHLSQGSVTVRKQILPSSRSSLGQIFTSLFFFLFACRSHPGNATRIVLFISIQYTTLAMEPRRWLTFIGQKTKCPKNMAFQWAQSDRKFGIWESYVCPGPPMRSMVLEHFLYSDQPITNTVMSTNFINVPLPYPSFSCSGLVCLPFWFFWTRTRSNSGYLQCLVYWFNQEEWVLWQLASQYSAQEPPFLPLENTSI